MGAGYCEIFVACAMRTLITTTVYLIDRVQIGSNWVRARLSACLCVIMTMT